MSTFISEIEADHKGVPILLKQYLRLGGRLLGFNVDPAFSNVLDVLITVDLRRTQRKILARYMGRESLVEFRMDHDGSVLSATVPSVFLPKPGMVLWLMARRGKCFVFPKGD